jgi:hypothetical protein
VSFYSTCTGPTCIGELPGWWVPFPINKPYKALRHWPAFAVVQTHGRLLPLSPGVPGKLENILVS